MPIRVRPLRWDDGDSNCYCLTICGMLELRRWKAVWGVLLNDHLALDEVFQSLKQAKAAAFRWYEQRILEQVEEVQE